MSKSREALIVVLSDGVRKRKVEEMVQRKVAAGQCLGMLEDGCECQGKAVKLGLCVQCYNKFFWVFKSLPKPKATQYVKRLVGLGYMLYSGEVRKMKQKSFWRRMA